MGKLYLLNTYLPHQQATSCAFNMMLTFCCRVLYGSEARYFEDEIKPQLAHKKIGTVAMSNTAKNMNGSQVS